MAVSRPVTGVMPSIETLVTEDDTPADDMPSEKQQWLLTPLYSSWAGPGAGRSFLATANVGVFRQARNPAIEPDVFLSLDVQVVALDGRARRRHPDRQGTRRCGAPACRAGTPTGRPLGGRCSAGQGSTRRSRTVMGDGNGYQAGRRNG